MRRALVVLALAGCRYRFDAIAEDEPDGSMEIDSVGSGHLELSVVGAGAVTAPGGIACAETCGYELTGPVTLTAQAAEGWQLDHFAAPCGTQPTCTIDPGIPMTATFVRAPITANRVFVSATAPPLTGLASIDTFCNQIATTAGVGGSYVAFLSTTTQDARDRLTGSRGWVRIDGLPVLDLPTSLTALPRPVLLDQNGTPRPAFEIVMTGSLPDGTRTINHCTNWASTGGTYENGRADSTPPYMIGGGTVACTTPGHVYCFETGGVAPVDLTPPAFPVGRYVFITTGPFATNTGIAGADATCQTEATAAGLPGTYRALLATTQQSVVEHVGSLAGIWRRPDGIVVTRTGLDQEPLDATIESTASGTLPANTQVFYGATSSTVRSSGPNDNCSDWSMTTGNSWVAYGFGAYFLSTTGFGQVCGTNYSLSCAQI